MHITSDCSYSARRASDEEGPRSVPRDSENAYDDGRQVLIVGRPLNERAHVRTEKPRHTPLVRRLAAELRVELADVVGTGLGGRVAKRDVMQAAERGPARRAMTVSHSHPVRTLGRGESLIAAVEVDVTDVLALRESLKLSLAGIERSENALMPFLARAAIDALQGNQALNTTVQRTTGAGAPSSRCDVAITVDTPLGSLAPVLRDAGVLSVPGLARRIADLTERARKGRLAEDEHAAASFTITARDDVLFEAPTIQPPQVATLSFGAVLRRAAVIDHPELGEVIAVRRMVMVALRVDERVVDGSLASRFLRDIKKSLESPRFDV